MQYTAEQVLKYFQGNILATLAIAVIAGFAAIQSVAPGKSGNFVLYFIVGLLGSFLGQFAMLYFGIDQILSELSNFRLLFDFIAAYLGSFALSSLIHFVKPM